MPGKQFDFSVLFRVIDKMSEPARKIGRSMSQLSIPLQRLSRKFVGLSENMKKAGERMKSVGKSMALKLTAPLVLMGTLAGKASMDFNAAMANVATLIPGNIDRVKELKKSVQDMAIATGTSTDIVAGGLYQVISAFGDSAESAGILEINSKAAAAGLATVEDAVNLTSAVMKGYGNINKEAANKSADLAFQTVKLGQTTFPELAASIGRVVPLAAKLAVSQEELFAGFATLTGVTGSASEVSTQLSGTLRSMLKPTKEMKDAVNALGYDSAKAMLGDKGLVGSLKELVKYTGGSEEALATMFGRVEPLIALFSLTGAQAGDYTKKLDAMTKASGSMNEAFDEQTKGINKAGFAWKQFKVQMVILAQKFGDTFGPTIEKITDFLGGLIDWMGKLSPSTKKVIVIIAALAAILGPIIIAVGMLTAAIGAIAAVGGPVLIVIGAIVAAITAIGTAIAFAFDTWKEFSAAMKGIFVGDQPKGGYSAEEEFFGKGGLAGMDKQQTEIKIKIASDKDSIATVEEVKNITGSPNVNIATEAYVGAH